MQLARKLFRLLIEKIYQALPLFLSAGRLLIGNFSTELLLLNRQNIEFSNLLLICQRKEEKIR